MIFVDGVPSSASFRSSSSSTPTGREILAALLEHPYLVHASNRFASTPARVLSFEDPSSPPLKLVYIFQREYATVDPALVQFIGTDESTTCVGLVIRNKNNGLTSVSHMDFPKAVEIGLSQMLSLLKDDMSAFDVHLIGGYDDATIKGVNDNSGSGRKGNQDGFSLPLCAKIVEALHHSPQHFHLQTLCILGHNTKISSTGNALPIVRGFLVDTSCGSVVPARFDRSSRGPDEIVRRTRVSVSSGDPRWKGRLLETYDTSQDKFQIAPCAWISDYWCQIASSVQQLSDDEMLFRCSTSPYAEAPDFVNNERRMFSYLINNPNWLQTYKGNMPRIFQRTPNGGWSACQ